MADLLGGLVSAGLTYGMQKQLQKDAQDYNTLMWNKANAYNSPLQQMMRFKAAGLNPNLIYSQMNNGASAPSMSASSAPGADIGVYDTVLAVKSLQKIQSEIDLNNAGVKEKEASADEKGAQTKLLTTQEMINQADLDIRKRLADSNISVNDETIKQIQANITKIAQETDNLKVENAIRSLELQWNEKTFDERVKLVEAQVKAANAQANAANAQAELSRAQAHRITTLLNQELSNLQAEFAEIQARTDLTQQEKSNKAQQKIIDAADNYYLMLATELGNNGNWFERNAGVFGAQIVHMFTHLFKFGKSF